MSWRDNSSSANPNSTNDGSGGSMSGSGSVSGTGGGGFGGQGGITTGDRGGYNFNRMSNGTLGNWNSGTPYGYGTVANGVTPYRREAIPSGPMGQGRGPVRPPIRPVAPIPRPKPFRPGQVTDVWYDPSIPLDPSIPGQLGAGPASPYGTVVGTGVKDPSRHPGMGNGTGSVGGGRGGGGGGGWKRGGNVDKPSILKRILARSKPKQAIDAPAPKKVTQRVTGKKTPWKKGGAKKPAFAKGGAVEKFMARYPSFKLT